MPTQSPPRVRLTTYVWRGLLLVAVLAIPAATFVFPAALVWRAGGSGVLAFVVGLLACPGLPLTWHLLAELRRRKRPPEKSTLRGIDRLGLRAAASCVVVLSVVALGWGRDAMRAVDHGRGRIRLAAIGSTGTDEGPLHAMDPALVALVPDGATALAAIPDPIGSLDRINESGRANRAKKIEELADACGIDFGHVSLFAAWSNEGFVGVLRAPGLDNDAVHCALRTEGRADQPDLDEVTETDVPGGVRWKLGEDEAELVVGYVADFGAVIVVTPSWADAIAARLAGHGGAVHLDRFADPLRRVEAAEGDVDGWLVTAGTSGKDAPVAWQTSSWTVSFLEDAATATGLIETADAATAQAERDRLAKLLDEFRAETKKGGLDLGGGLRIEFTVDGTSVRTEAHCDPEGLFWSVWTSGMLHGLTNDLFQSKGKSGTAEP